MSKSHIFSKILKQVCNNKTQSFRVSDFSFLKSQSFLSKHRKGNTGKNKPYFIRISRGLYRINPLYKKCN